MSRPYVYQDSVHISGERAQLGIIDIPDIQDLELAYDEPTTLTITEFGDSPNFSLFPKDLGIAYIRYIDEYIEAVPITPPTTSLYNPSSFYMWLYSIFSTPEFPLFEISHAIALESDGQAPEEITNPLIDLDGGWFLPLTKYYREPAITSVEFPDWLSAYLGRPPAMVYTNMQIYLLNNSQTHTSEVSYSVLMQEPIPTGYDRNVFYAAKESLEPVRGDLELQALFRSPTFTQAEDFDCYGSLVEIQNIHGIVFRRSPEFTSSRGLIITTPKFIPGSPLEKTSREVKLTSFSRSGLTENMKNIVPPGPINFATARELFLGVFLHLREASSGDLISWPSEYRVSYTITGKIVGGSSQPRPSQYNRAIARFRNPTYKNTLGEKLLGNMLQKLPKGLGSRSELPSLPFTPTAAETTDPEDLASYTGPTDKIHDSEDIQDSEDLTPQSPTEPHQESLTLQDYDSPIGQAPEPSRTLQSYDGPEVSVVEESETTTSDQEIKTEISAGLDMAPPEEYIGDLSKEEKKEDEKSDLVVDEDLDVEIGEKDVTEEEVKPSEDETTFISALSDTIKPIAENILEVMKSSEEKRSYEVPDYLKTVFASLPTREDVEKLTVAISEDLPKTVENTLKEYQIFSAEALTLGFSGLPKALSELLVRQAEILTHNQGETSRYLQALQFQNEEISKLRAEESQYFLENLEPLRSSIQTIESVLMMSDTRQRNIEIFLASLTEDRLEAQQEAFEDRETQSRTFQDLTSAVDPLGNIIEAKSLESFPKPQALEDSEDLQEPNNYNKKSIQGATAVEGSFTDSNGQQTSDYPESSQKNPSDSETPEPQEPQDSQRSQVPSEPSETSQYSDLSTPAELRSKIITLSLAYSNLETTKKHNIELLSQAYNRFEGAYARAKYMWELHKNRSSESSETRTKRSQDRKLLHLSSAKDSAERSLKEIDRQMGLEHADLKSLDSIMKSLAKVEEELTPQEPPQSHKAPVPRNYRDFTSIRSDILESMKALRILSRSESKGNLLSQLLSDSPPETFKERIFEVCLDSKPEERSFGQKFSQLVDQILRQNFVMNREENTKALTDLIISTTKDVSKHPKQYSEKFKNYILSVDLDLAEAISRF